MTKNRRHKINSNMTLSKWIFFAATCGVVFALYFMFCVVPILQSVKMSFYKWGGYKTKTYIQWKNYADVLKDHVFWKALKNDLIITLIKEILICSLTVLFAVTLTRFRMKTPEVVLYKFVFYIPNVISTIIIGSLWGFVFMPSGMGLMNSICSIFKSGVDIDWVTKYPLGVIGIILSMMVLRRVFRIDFAKEEKKALDTMDVQHDSVAQPHSLSVVNPALEDKSIRELQGLVNRDFVISRIRRQGGEIEIADDDTLLHVGDQILVVTTPRDAAAITAFIGRDVQVEWEQLDKRLISRRILITKPELNGKSLAQLKLHAGFGVSITRVNRAGVDLIAQPSLQLQMGDRVTVVGTEVSIANVEKVLGNSMKRLNAPNLIPIFIGIVLGVMLGSLPFTFPGIPQPVKLGLAGGPLIVSILISRFGPKFKLVTYTTMSANLMLREVGIALFLACVGLGAGEEFVETIIDGGGYAWIGYGAIITILPLLIVGVIGRLWFKVDYFTLIGVMAGATTDPPALAYSNDLAGNDIPSVGYATVYPLTMFLRVLSAQLLILFLA